MSIVIPTPEELKRLRLQAGLTQKELAERAGVSQSLIARIESGSVDPRISTLRRIISAIPFRERFKTASQIMCSPVIYVAPQDTIRKAVDLMERHGISQLPVIDGDTVVGSVKENSLIREVSRSRDPYKIFDKKVKEVMDELGLSGGRVKILVESVGVRVGFNKRKMRVAVKRALIGGEPTVKKR